MFCADYTSSTAHIIDVKFFELKVWDRTFGFGISEYWIIKKQIFIYHYRCQVHKFLHFFFYNFFLSWKNWQRTTKLLKNILEVIIISWFLRKQFIFVYYYPEWKHCKSKLMHSMNYFTLKLLFTSIKQQKVHRVNKQHNQNISNLK